MNDNSIINHPRYIDLLSDYGFKRIFGTEPNKDLLIAFLNELFRGEKHIVDLVYNKNEHPGDVINEGGAIFDLLCTGNEGEYFIIEVQRSRQKNFKDRTVFYNSKLLSDQAPKGRRNDWAYALKEVYLIAILDGFVLYEDEEEYIQDIYLCNIRTGKIFTEKSGYTFIELLKFTKTESELETELDKWLYVLKNMSNMDKIPLYLRKPIFEKLFNIAEYSKLTKEEKMAYDQRQKWRWDNKNAMDYAIETGMEKGMKQGLEKGMVQGIEKGIEKGKEIGLQEGIEQGKLEATKEIARKLKNENAASELIAKLTGLTTEEINNL